MNQVVLDAGIRSRLNGLDQPLEFCDENGRIVGHFLPHDMYRQMLIDYARAVVPDEEVERRLQENGGCSLQEIWARLGNT